jgi:mannose-6-phosphate isomerase-like protein (cupin superfamily)
MMFMSILSITPKMGKNEVFEHVEKFLIESGFEIHTKDSGRPWGGFFVLQEKDIRKFKEAFFPTVVLTEEQFKQKLSPKFLLVSPKARLSWQYHFRRSELWTLIAGSGSISRSLTDVQGDPVALKVGEVIKLEKGERHRLIGESDWGIVAEIWVHTDPSYPSDESDIVRLQDDYART